MDATHNTRERLAALVEGRVQGVGFRYFVEENALALNLDGWVRNRWDGKVELVAEGDKEVLEKFLATIWRGPRMAFVSNVKVDWLPATGEFHGFRIRPTA